jgi:hypothetical protein
MARHTVSTSSRSVELLGLVIDPDDLPPEAFEGLEQRGLVLSLRSDGLGVILKKAEHDLFAACSAWLCGQEEVTP